jgi:uncharacterized membrane protein
MRIGRLFKHWFATPGSLRRAFPAPVLDHIAQAITHAEAQTTGEIRFALEAALPWSYLRRDAPARQRAVMVFAKLQVWDTEHNNGVLLYVDLADRSVEIVADRGIAGHVPTSEWEAICATIRTSFRQGAYEAGAVGGIEAIGAVLARHFPLAAGAANPNELPNRPVSL